MTLLEFFFIVAAVVIFITALDIVNKRRFNALHFVIFLFIGGSLFTFSIYPNVVNKIGQLFGVARGADVLVYISIIFLFYFVLLLLKKITETQDNMTNLVRELAIENSSKRFLVGKEAFIIPVYNEEGIILEVINNILEDGYKNIIVINDGSSDKSKEILKSLGESIVLLNHLKNRGQGAALETGFEYVRRYTDVDYVITFDADGQHRLEDMYIFENYMHDNPKSEVFLGSRFLSDKTEVPFTRRIILKIGIIFTWIISGMKLSDAHNGYRLIKRGALDKIRISQDGMSHASEIIDIIAEKKIKYTEVPVDIKYTNYSMRKGQKSSNAISIAFRTIWNKFFR